MIVYPCIVTRARTNWVTGLYETIDVIQCERVNRARQGNHLYLPCVNVAQTLSNTRALLLAIGQPADEYVLLASPCIQDIRRRSTYTSRSTFNPSRGREA